MKLFLINSSGKKVELMHSNPKVKSRGELAQSVGGRWFTLDGSDYEYDVNEVIAEPSPDTTIGSFLFAFMFMWVIIRFFIPTLILSGLIYLIACYFRYRDNEAVQKFNNS